MFHFDVQGSVAGPPPAASAIFGCMLRRAKAMIDNAHDLPITRQAQLVNISRRVLSHRVSITMEADFCVEALEEALAKYDRPEIFNVNER